VAAGKRYLSFFLKVFFSFGIVAFMLFSVDFDKLKASLSGINLGWYILSLLLYVSIQPIRSFRWGLLLWKREIDVSFWRLLSLYFVGLFFSTFLPTLVGGDVVRGYYLFRHTEAKSKAVASIFLDRFSGVYALAIMSFIAGAISFGRFAEQKVFLAVCLSALVLLALFSVIFWSRSLHLLLLPFQRYNPLKIREKGERFIEDISAYRPERGLLALILVLSILFNAMIIMMVYWLSLSLGWDVSLIDFFVFIPMVTLISMFPLALSGLGAREGSMAFFMAFVGIPLHESLSLSALWFSLTLILGFIGGVFYLFMRKKPIQGKT
jgi:uncharacterized protein (TIRG00374 family)